MTLVLRGSAVRARTTLGRFCAHAFIVMGFVVLVLLPFRLRAAEGLRIYADAGAAAMIGSGFITQDPRIAGDSDYVLVTALHVLRQRGFAARNVTIQTASDDGRSAYLSSIEYHAWPGFDLAAIPIDAREVEALGAQPLELVGFTPPHMLHEYAALAVPDQSPLSGAVEGVVAAHKWKEGIENANGSASTLAAFAPGADLLIYSVSTARGMSGAPLVLDGRVIGVHLQGVAEGAEYQEFAVAVMLEPSALGLPVASRDLLDAQLVEPALNQSDAAGLPPDIRERLALTKAVAALDEHPGVVSGFHIYSGVLIGRDPEVFRSSHTGLLLDLIAKGGLPAGKTRGVGFGAVLGLGYARIRRDVGNGPEGKNAFWMRTGFGPAFFRLNPERLSSINLGIYPVLDLFGLRAARIGTDERAETAVAVGGLLTFRVASLRKHLALVVHSAFLGHRRKLQVQGATGWAFGFEAGLGLGGVFGPFGGKKRDNKRN